MKQGAWGGWRRGWIVFVGLTLLVAVPRGAGQELARRNWQGSGLTMQPWWARAVFCFAGSSNAETLQALVARMDAMQALGCDAVEMNLGRGDGPEGLSFAAMDGMDALIGEAGRRKIRVVVDLPVSAGALTAGGETGLQNRIRFWLARGVAGFVLDGAGVTSMESVSGLAHRIRQAMGGALGGRVLIAENAVGATAASEDCQLQVRELSGREPWVLRDVLSRAVAGQGVLPLIAARSVTQEKAQAAMLLLSGVAARISLDDVLPVDAVSGSESESRFSAEDLLLWIPNETPAAGLALGKMGEWYQALGVLHHGNSSLRSGQALFPNLGATGVLAWVVPARNGREAVLVVCNLSGRPARLEVTAALRAQGVKGSFLKALIRSEKQTGNGATLGGIELGADEVFVGEIR